MTSKNEIENLENKYQAKIQVVSDKDGTNSKIVVQDVDKNLNQIIENEIQNLIRMKSSASWLSEFLPGFEKLSQDKKFGFQTIIDHIQSMEKSK